jgi:phage host-nuclease inhibitor protein Gam
MDIDEIIQNLNEQVQILEDLKTNIIELQEETCGLIAGVNMWFEQHKDELSEVKGE